MRKLTRNLQAIVLSSLEISELSWSIIKTSFFGLFVIISLHVFLDNVSRLLYRKFVLWQAWEIDWQAWAFERLKLSVTLGVRTDRYTSPLILILGWNFWREISQSHTYRYKKHCVEEEREVWEILTRS